VQKSKSPVRKFNGNLKGIPASAGIAIGKAKIIQPEIVSLNDSKIDVEEIPGELELFDRVIETLVEEFNDVIKKVKTNESNVVAIIESNLLILKDPYVNESIKNYIKSGLNIENAVVKEFDSKKQFFKESKDDILKERAHELDHIKKRILSALRQQCLYYGVAKDAIVIAQSLTPTDIINFKEAGALGFITEVGGIASHASILARTFEIPSVIGVKNVLESIPEDSEVIIDGYSGHIIYNPKQKNLAEFYEKKEKIEEHRKSLGELIKLPAKTIDNETVKLLANVDTPQDIRHAHISGAEGAGLVRSEQLIVALNRFPSEEEQIEYYEKIAESAYPHHVTLRTFDIGSDKYSEGMPHHEDNPALGLRGIRFLLSRKDIFKTQIKAILKVSKNKNIRLMLPMIVSFSEVQDSLKIIDECKKELENSDISFDKNIPIGIMIETPAAALISDRLAKFVDFFSIGTNDLTQYTLAADRGNELVSSVFDSFHPAVLNLIKISADNARKNNIPISVCGELAGHAAATSLLIGLGIRELSVSPSMILELKNRIRHLKYKKSKKLAADILKSTSYNEVIKRLEKEISF
jgi:phosphotransferase system enzyme I (PtsI)